MPTRITDSSATIIDHVFSNSYGNSSHKSGILCTDISDHFANFIISINNQVTHRYESREFIRIYNKINIEKFQTSLISHDWHHLLSLTNVNAAYNNFSNVVTSAFMKSFPLVKASRKCCKNKSWVTPGLLVSIKTKHKLYKKWLKTRSQTAELNLKKYK